MARCFLSAIFTLLIVLAGPALAQQNDASTDFGKYVTLPKPTEAADPQKKEAVLFFWYGCGSCFKLEMAMAEKDIQWPTGVKLIKRPALSNPTWKFHGQIYLALEALGVNRDTHLQVFDLFQNKRVRVVERDALPELTKNIGINHDKFIKAFDSPEVAAQMEQIIQLEADYDLNVVPTMVIDGHYKFEVGMVRTIENFIKQAEFLGDKSFK